jgi:hypothetical protein
MPTQIAQSSGRDVPYGRARDKCAAFGQHPKASRPLAAREWRAAQGVGPAIVNMEIGVLRRIMSASGGGRKKFEVATVP